MSKVFKVFSLNIKSQPEITIASALIISRYPVPVKRLAAPSGFLEQDKG